MYIRTYMNPVLCYLPSQVVCDFSTKPPANILNNNKLDTVHATGKEASRSYVIDINYNNASLTAISTLIDSAVVCSQYLKTKCKHIS